ncbi:LysR substrate-binding domain-containing protein [Sulfurimonas sp.]|uniref:LysR substrate-binding domain-containing protein n=1 Tax=Sulfurimonas sp. TaxID=2022749 RepID=UPI00263349BA|nr:LysR substrate-binding domain-containing protein [Sulfurimonas sp.]MDD5156970.1 LysR substrate-binding domain-containing protein [Sulfurimonas sp.]
MFTLKQLEVFISLAYKQKVIDVAMEFQLSQSAISMSIKELESIIGEKLFERIGKRLTLNERGVLFLELITPQVDALRKIYANFSSQKIEGNLRLCASATIANYLIPKYINKYNETHQNVKFSLKSTNTNDAIKLIKDGTYDIGFIEDRCNDEMLICKKIASDELVVVVANSELAKVKEHFIDTLASMQWIMREVGSGTRSTFLNTISPENINIYMEFDHTETIKNFLKLSPNYISCLPRISVEQELKDGSLFELPIRGYDFKRDFILIMRKEKKNSMLANDFMKFILH